MHTSARISGGSTAGHLLSRRPGEVSVMLLEKLERNWKSHLTNGQLWSIFYVAILLWREVMLISQAAIARSLNLSQRTISLCLANSPLVAEQTRKRVMEAAEEMGYRPNRSAVSMRTGRFNAIALLQSTRRGYSYLPQVLLATVQDALLDLQMHLVLARVPDRQFADRSYLPSVLREWAVDGFLLNYTYGISNEVIEVIEAGNLPTIWMNTKRSWDCVFPDDVNAGRMLTERLLKLGHRRIAFFSSRPFEEHYSVSDRYEGYAQVMRQAGLQPEKLFHSDKEFKEVAGGFSFLRDVLASSQRPTAIVAYEAFEAARVLYSAFRLGLEVPRDLSLVTFHEIDAGYMGFPITTAIIPEEQMGKLAITTLLQKIKVPNQRIAAHAVPFVEISGASVGAAPAV